MIVIGYPDDCDYEFNYDEFDDRDIMKINATADARIRTMNKKKRCLEFWQ